jgi:hypothetical protein
MSAADMASASPEASRRMVFSMDTSWSISETLCRLIWGDVTNMGEVARTPKISVRGILQVRKS